MHDCSRLRCTCAGACRRESRQIRRAGREGAVHGACFGDVVACERRVEELAKGAIPWAGEVVAGSLGACSAATSRCVLTATGVRPWQGSSRPACRIGGTLRSGRMAEIVKEGRQ